MASWRSMTKIAGSVPKCHGSATLKVLTYRFGFQTFTGTLRLYDWLCFSILWSGIWWSEYLALSLYAEKQEPKEQSFILSFPLEKKKKFTYQEWVIYVLYECVMWKLRLWLLWGPRSSYLMISCSTTLISLQTEQGRVSLSSTLPRCSTSYLLIHSCSQKSLNWPLSPIGARNPSPPTIRKKKR